MNNTFFLVCVFTVCRIESFVALACSVSSKLRKAALKSLKVRFFSLWVVTTAKDLHVSGIPFKTVASNKLSVTCSPAFFRAAAAFFSSDNIVSNSFMGRLYQ